ncbi:MAG: hypothetical protein SPJ13_06470 [Bacteroidales bacterium]|nr:hypothetical protein [Bacteroidales bacterium]
MAHHDEQTFLPYASAKPFIMWAGGKTLFLGEFAQAIPADIHGRKCLTFIKPLIGEGSLLVDDAEHAQHVTGCHLRQK